MKFLTTLVFAVTSALTTSAVAFDTPLQAYTMTPDIVYGQGAVQKNGETSEVDLWMDWWAPVDQDLTTPRPTVIFTHGGS